MEPNIAKTRPPRLATIDRTISMSIENYIPPPSASSSKLVVRSAHNITDQLSKIDAPSSSSTIATAVLQKDFNRHKLYHMNRSHNSVVSEEPPCFTRKPLLKRSDTINVHGDAMEMRKTHSFQSSMDVQPTIAVISDLVPPSKRAASFRLLPVYAGDVKMDKKSPTPSIRRSCKMHRSFNEQTRKVDQRKDVVIETLKCHSLGDEDPDFPIEVKKKLSPKFGTGLSMEEDVYRSGSSSRNHSIDKISDSDHSASRKLSSQSLDKQYKFQRGSKYSHSFYLTPNSPEEPTENVQFREKRQHSASVRARPHRDLYALGATKKSKSFISKPEFERSPQPLQRRRDSAKIFSADNGRKSPCANLIIPESVHSVDSRSNLSTNAALDYDSIIRVYQQSRRKSSVLPVEKKTKNILDASDSDGELYRKRRKIICIIVTVFFSLLFASVFVVIFTLTHSVDTLVQNQTKKVYTFSRDVPIHHNGNSTFF